MLDFPPFKRAVALIPARGGSKGIPRKNVAPICGQPLVGYTLRAATDSRHISAVYLSSDDDEILDIGRKLGCKPVVRPGSLASDTAMAVDVVNHFVETELESSGDDVLIVYLQPTSPLRTAAHIDESIDLMGRAGKPAVVSVVELDKSPFKSFIVNERGELQSIFDEEMSNKNRQSLPKAYIPNGAIYGFQLGIFRARRCFPSNGSMPYVMNRRDSIDIDTMEDMELVRQIMERSSA